MVLATEFSVTAMYCNPYIYCSRHSFCSHQKRPQHFSMLNTDICIFIRHNTCHILLACEYVCVCEPHTELDENHRHQSMYADRRTYRINDICHHFSFFTPPSLFVLPLQYRLQFGPYTQSRFTVFIVLFCE